MWAGSGVHQSRAKPERRIMLGAYPSNSPLDVPNPFRHSPPRFFGAGAPFNGRVACLSSSSFSPGGRPDAEHPLLHLAARRIRRHRRVRQQILPRQIRPAGIDQGTPLGDLQRLFRASTIPPGWHGWMHHRVDVPPSKDDYAAREWQKPHMPNQTGTPNAYRRKARSSPVPLRAARRRLFCLVAGLRPLRPHFG